MTSKPKHPLDLDIIVLVEGTCEGRDHWAFLAVPPDQYEAFLKAERSGKSFKLEKYGKVLHEGEGESPPEHVVKELQDKYGIDPDFETTIKNTLQSMHDELKKY